jgi:hypothetical protein
MADPLIIQVVAEVMDSFGTMAALERLYLLVVV